MDEGQLLGRGVGFPVRLGPDGRWAWSAGAQNIRESIRIILSTETQERLMLPEFGGGLRPFLFQPNTSTSHRLIQERITRALSRWERRITPLSVEVAADTANEQQALATITYRLVAQETTEQLTLAVSLTG